MEYEERVITFMDSRTSTVEIPAFVGKDTGLACAEIDDGTFRVIHVSSGYSLPHVPRDIDEAKRYLENLVGLFEDHWLSDEATFKKRFRRHQSLIIRKVREAYEASLRDPDDELFLYARRDNDAYPESNTDAANIDPNDPGNRHIAEKLLKDYPEADRVVMVRMDDEAIHHELRTFLRSTVAVKA